MDLAKKYDEISKRALEMARKFGCQWVRDQYPHKLSEKDKSKILNVNNIKNHMINMGQVEPIKSLNVDWLKYSPYASWTDETHEEFAKKMENKDWYDGYIEGEKFGYKTAVYDILRILCGDRYASELDYETRKKIFYILTNLYYPHIEPPELE